MNKIFHAKVVWYHYVTLTMLTVAIIWSFSVQNVMAAVFMVATVVLIEKIIHTTYTVTTDGKLVIYRGRFSKKQMIEIKDIQSVEARHSMNFGKFHFSEFVLIRYSGEKYISLEPVKEQEFIALINKIKNGGKHILQEKAE